jgi:HrpA-like RNA helicase
MSLAKRVSYETLNEYRTEVAYQVRFERTRTKHTKILFLTEGVLLRQLQTDSQLSAYSYIVVDEVHERHVFTDFLLGILKCLMEQRKSLKIILMSATINIDLFSKYFNDCVVVKVRTGLELNLLQIHRALNRFVVLCSRYLAGPIRSTSNTYRF